VCCVLCIFSGLPHPLSLLDGLHVLHGRVNRDLDARLARILGDSRSTPPGSAGYIPGMPQPTAKELIRHLHFRYADGSVTRIGVPHETAWRFMPWTVIVQAVGCSFEVVLGDGQVLAGGDGDCLIAPDLRHRLRVTSGEVARARWAHLDFTIFESINLLALFDLPLIVSGSTAERLGDLCEQMWRTSDAPRQNRLIRAVTLERLGFEMLELLLQLGRPRGDFDEFFTRAQRFAEVLGLIAREYTRPVSVQELAETAGLSPSRFHAAFREVFGVSPMAYVRDHRLEQARLLLSSTDRTVGQVASRVGYRDQFHFSRHFKRRFGTSPAAFRRSVHAVQ